MLYAKTRTRRAALQVRVDTHVPRKAYIRVRVGHVHGTLEARQLIRKDRKIVTAANHALRVEVTVPRTVHINVLAGNAQKVQGAGIEGQGNFHRVRGLKVTPTLSARRRIGSVRHVGARMLYACYTRYACSLRSLVLRTLRLSRSVISCPYFGTIHAHICTYYATSHAAAAAHTHAPKKPNRYTLHTEKANRFTKSPEKAGGWGETDSFPFREPASHRRL